MQYLLAFIKAVGDIASALNSIYEFSKNVKDYFADPTDVNRQRYWTTYSLLISVHRAISAASSEILSAISTLDRRIFQEVLSDKLGDIDQAMQDLDNWQRTRSEVLRGLALDRSAGAVADMLQYAQSGIYPRPAVVFPFIGMLNARLAILKEADPGFCKSPTARRPIEEGIALIRSAAGEIEALLRLHTDIQVQRFIRKQRDDDPLVGAEISYYNLSGTVSYRETVGPFELLSPALEEAIQRARAAAEAARTRGLMEDLQGTEIPNLRTQAVTIEESLRLCELEMLSQVLPYPISSIERARFMLERQEKTLSQSVGVLFGGLTSHSVDDSAAALDVPEVSEQLLNRRPTKQEAKVLTDVAQVFGYGSALQLLINHPDSAIE